MCFIAFRKLLDDGYPTDGKSLEVSVRTEVRIYEARITETSPPQLVDDSSEETDARVLKALLDDVKIVGVQGRAGRARVKDGYLRDESLRSWVFRSGVRGKCAGNWV